MAREFLSPAVRWSIANLERLGPPGGMLVSINPERMLVQVDRNLGQYGDGLVSAVHEALIVHDGLREGVARAAQRRDRDPRRGPASVTDDGPPICKVCGEPIESPCVVCEVCDTPHHPRLLGVCGDLLDLRM